MTPIKRNLVRAQIQADLRERRTGLLASLRQPLTENQVDEIEDITGEAIHKCPSHLRDQLEEYFYHLATKAVERNSDRYLQVIQSMLDSARSGDYQQLARVTQKLDIDIQTLREETITAFNAVGDEIGAINHRLNRLENTPRQTPQTRININFDNTSNAILWVILGTLIVGTVGTLLTPVVDTYQHQETEVDKP